MSSDKIINNIDFVITFKAFICIWAIIQLFKYTIYSIIHYIDNGKFIVKNSYLHY